MALSTHVVGVTNQTKPNAMPMIPMDAKGNMVGNSHESKGKGYFLGCMMQC